MAEYYQPLAVSRGRKRRIFARYGTLLERLLLCLLLLVFILFALLSLLCLISPNTSQLVCGITDRTSTTVLLCLAGIGIVPTVVALYLSCLRNESIRFHGRGLSQGFSMKEETRRDDEGVLFVRPSSVGGERVAFGLSWLKKMLFVRYYFQRMTAHLLLFMLPIVFIDTFPNSLRPGAIVGLAAYAACLLFLPCVQSFLVRSNRLSATVHRVLDHMTIAVAALICLHLLIMQRRGDIDLSALMEKGSRYSHAALGVSLKKKKKFHPAAAPLPLESPMSNPKGNEESTWETVLFALAVVFLAGVEILERSNTLNDWASVISRSCVSSDSESEDDYAFVSGHYMEDVDEINWARGSKHSRSIQRAFTRINLLCRVLAVVSVVSVLQFGDNDKERVALGLLELGIIWIVLATLAQVIALRVLYRACPALAERNALGGSNTGALYEQFGATRASSRGRLLRGRVVASLHRLFRSWVVLFSNPFCLVNLSYCVLYASILVDGHQLLSYLRWKGTDPVTIGLVWIFAALSSFLGEGIAVATHRCTASLTKTGCLLLWLFALCICLAAMAFNDMFIDTLSLPEPLLAICCIVCSRGVYEAFSLAHVQLVQEHIEDDLLPYVLSTQTSLMFASLMASQAFTFAVDTPKLFFRLVTVSVEWVVMGAVLYLVWYICYDRGPYQVVDEIGRLKLDVRG